MTPRRAFHSSSRRLDRSKVKEEDEDDDNPWGDLDKAFENLEDKSLYKQVYLNPTSEPSVPPRTAPSMAKDPIAEMEEAIFAQAGAAAVKGATKPKRNVAMASLSGVKFSDVPPSAAGNGFPMDAASGSWDASVEGASGAKWSEYMQGGHSGGEDDDSPWSSLDAFVDNPESSAQFAVPLHLQSQQDVMQQRAQQHLPRAPSRQQHEHTLGEAFAANNEFLRQQTQLTSEEAMFAQAGAAAVDSISSAFSTPAAIVGQEDFGRLSHIDPTTGGASMVDVSHKTTTCRSATAIGRVYLPTHAAALIRTTESHSGVSGKGPVLHTAQLAGIMAAKRTADLIPLCHPLSLTHVDLKLSLADGDVKEGEGGESWVQVECTARTAGQTGVEMEALTGCTVACLTVWDMAKAVAGKTMRIGEIMVVKKSGGKSGDWQRTP